MMLYRLLVQGLLLCCVLAGSARAQDNPFTIAGSNIIGAELMPAIVELWLQQQGAANIRRQWTAKHQLWLQSVVPGAAPTSIKIDSSGSGSGFAAMALGEADLVMSSRPINPIELDNLKFFGSMNDARHQLLLALDGIAVVVHPDNPVTELRMDQLARIFSGQLTHWVQLQSPPQVPTDPTDRIQVLTHADDSGTTVLFRQLVMNGQALTDRADQFVSGNELARQVAQNRQSIGFTSLASIDNAKAVAIVNGGDPVPVNKITVATGEYPLSRSLYLYLPDPDGSMTQSLLSTAKSEAGQRMTTARSFVRLDLFASQVSVAENAPEEYRELTSGAQRLSLTLGFTDNASALQSGSSQYIDRVLDYIRKHVNIISDVMVFGFSDAAEASDVNRQILSVERADNVAKALLERGVPPTRVRGYGSSMPIGASDVTGAGKNRRVEIWVKTHDGKGSRPYRRLAR